MLFKPINAIAGLIRIIFFGVVSSGFALGFNLGRVGLGVVSRVSAHVVVLTVAIRMMMLDLTVVVTMVVAPRVVTDPHTLTGRVDQLVVCGACWRYKRLKAHQENKGRDCSDDRHRHFARGEGNQC